MLKVIDWALALPKDLELEHKDGLHALEEEKNMSYVTSFEKLSREAGLQQGLEQDLEQGLQQGRYEIAKRLLVEELSLDLVKNDQIT